MEPNFQTSFIPKKPMIEERISSPRTIGIFTLLSIFIFLTMVLGSAGVYFYKGILARRITDMENNLNLAKSRFEPSKITQLEVLDRRLNASNEILSSHIAISPIFKLLQLSTLKSIQFTEFDYELSATEEDKIIVNMKGIALGYRPIAFQSDILAENQYIIDPIFSNLTLDDKGNVGFELKFSVESSLVNYKQMLGASEVGNIPQNSGISTETFTNTEPSPVPVDETLINNEVNN